MQIKIVTQSHSLCIETYHTLCTDGCIYKMRNIKTHPYSAGKKQAPATCTATNLFTSSVLKPVHAPKRLYYSITDWSRQAILTNLHFFCYIYIEALGKMQTISHERDDKFSSVVRVKRPCAPLTPRDNTRLSVK